jgi:hypothetical protein
MKFSTRKFVLPKPIDGATLSHIMDTPRSLDATPATTPFDRLTKAVAQIDGVSMLALLAIFFGWFFLDTLAVTLGSLRHGVRFFDISAAVADPTRIFFGVDGTLQRVVFGFICLICLCVPLLPHWRATRAAWLAYLAPLALMMTCGALLYSRTSGEFFSAPAGTASLGGSVIRFANDLVHRSTGLVSRHVAVAVGGYLAFAGALVLAAQGMRHLRRHAP